jgi:hypothetical protein
MFYFQKDLGNTDVGYGEVLLVTVSKSAERVALDFIRTQHTPHCSVKFLKPK